MRRPRGERGGRTLSLTLTLHPHPHPHPNQLAGLLRGRFDVVLAADVINAEGLSELVFAIVRRYLACPGVYPKGRASRGAGVARGG